ncbi:ankyrin repeat-containing protein [Penicillium verhagenii]|nr:ankyrin repeat-containing protein [Penicillium verhagenii]
MTLLDLPMELILFIVLSLSDADLASLTTVNHRFQGLLPHLYQRHLENNPRQHGFFRAIAFGNKAAVRHFLYYGADVNATIRNPNLKNTPISPWFSLQTPLCVAANAGNDSLVALLLSHGAAVKPTSKKRIASWFTANPPVIDALLSGHESTVRLLLINGSPFCSPLLGLFDYALMKGRLSFLKLLVEFGFDLNIQSPEGIFPLQAALKAGACSTEMMRFLLDNGAGKDLMDCDYQSNILVRAIRTSTTDKLCLLLEYGAKIPPEILEKSVPNCHLETARLLLDHGCKPNYLTLKTVVKNKREDLLQLLIDNSVDLYMKDSEGWTILHEAVQQCPQNPAPTRLHSRSGNYGDTDPMDNELIRHVIRDPQPFRATRCKIDRFNLKTCAPEEIVRCLIRGGADLNALDAQGCTPLDLASSYSQEVQQILADSGGKFSVDLYT